MEPNQQCNRCLAGTMQLVKSVRMGDVVCEQMKCDQCGREDSRDVAAGPVAKPAKKKPARKSQ